MHRYGARRRHPTSSYIKVDHKLQAEIYALLGSASKIRLLIESRPKRRGQSRTLYRLQVKRTEALSELLEGLDVNAILGLEARHSVEHFDERIDRVAVEVLTGSIPMPVHMPTDMALGDLATMKVLKGTASEPGLYPMRVYLGAERRFLNAGADIDLDRLREQCAGIKQRLQPHIHSFEDGRGAVITVITDRSFPH